MQRKPLLPRNEMDGVESFEPEEHSPNPTVAAAQAQPAPMDARGPGPSSTQAGAQQAPGAAGHYSGTKPAPGPTLVQRIKDKLPILEYASRFTEFKPRGDRSDEHVGHCPDPSHEDKGASFYVNSSKNLFHCHGCGISGNVIQLFAVLNGMDQEEAKFTLGRELGVFNERHLDGPEVMMSRAAGRFYDQLQKKDDALNYLTNVRGVSQESIERFGIGFCWGREFMDFTDVSQQRMAIETGLAREDSGRSYMAGRIVFPVRDRGGRVVGFAGRLVPSEFKSNGPKYINSPETAWFKKSELLYGAYEASAGISKAGSVVVVEGYLDVIGLHQAGVTNAVAVMGAFANDTTYKNLWDMTKRVVFCLDGDIAGSKGAMRAAMAAAPSMKDGCEISIAQLPEGMDPDEYVLKFGAEAFRSLCDRGVPLSRYLMESRSINFDLNFPEGRAAFLAEANSVAENFGEAPMLREQIVAEARALNAAALVDFALKTTGLAENVEPRVLKDAIALLQRRLAMMTPAQEPANSAQESQRKAPRP